MLTKFGRHPIDELEFLRVDQEDIWKGGKLCPLVHCDRFVAGRALVLQTVSVGEHPETRLQFDRFPLLFRLLVFVAWNLGHFIRWYGKADRVVAVDLVSHLLASPALQPLFHSKFERFRWRILLRDAAFFGLGTDHFEEIGHEFFSILLSHGGKFRVALSDKRLEHGWT